MTNLRHDRVPGQTLSPGSVPEARATADGKVPGSTRGTVLAIRLWTQDSSGQPGAVSWQSTSPAVCLALDVIAASGGAPEPAQGSNLSAGFHDAQSALLAVRRLQWALQGLVEEGSSRNVKAAILIRPADDPSGGSIQAALDNAAPGQVLLSSGIAQSVHQLPNVTLRGDAQGGWSEMVWRSSETDAGSAADEQSVLRLIRELGREDPSAPQPQAPASSPAETSTEPTLVSSSSTGTFTARRRSRAEDEGAQPGAKKKWLIIGGAAAALLVIGILVIVGLVSGHHGKAPQPVSPGPITTPVESAPPPKPALPPDTSNTTEQANPNSKKTKPTQGSVPSARSKTDAGGAVKIQPSGTCDLTETEIPRVLNRAESDMHAGRLSDAQAEYQRLLGCPSARQKAVEGLQLVKRRIAAGSSDQ